MPFKVDASSIHWIDNNQALADAAGLWGDVIGLDTEFQRTDTFFPLPGLYQVCSDERVDLIDPLSISDWSPFVALLEDDAKVKVMHACGEDLELMFRHLDVRPKSLFDTQLAYAFISPNFSFSYARLVDATMSAELDKGATRSDWRKRPLTSAQLQYAAADVWHLAEIYQQMREQLESLGRWQWFAEDMANHGYYQEPVPADHYKNVKGARRLTPDALARLQRLCQWREETAMSRNRPRNRIIRDEHLLTIAGWDQFSRRQLGSTLPPRVAARYADQLEAVTAVESGNGQEVPALPAPLTSSENKVVSAMRDQGKVRAQRLGMAEELLSRKRDVESCAKHFLRSGQLSDLYQGWRSSLLGEEFLERLRALPSSPKLRKVETG